MRGLPGGVERPRVVASSSVPSKGRQMSMRRRLLLGVVGFAVSYKGR